MRAFHQHCGRGEGVDRRFARGGFSRGERFGGRGSGMRRALEHGDLQPLILHLIQEKPRHGYEVIKAIEELFGGHYSPSPGVVYPTLTLLEETGQVESTADGARKSYAITEAGKAALEANKALLEVILARVAAMQPQAATLPVMRAMENLRTALRMKMTAGGANAEVIRKIADQLDAAVRAIEEI